MRRYHMVLYGVWFALVFTLTGAAAWWNRHVEQGTADHGDQPA